MRSLKKKDKVFVAMSGGVDSSVSAALLKEATPNNFEKLFGRPTPDGFNGYDVTGVFMKVWHPDFLPCTWKEDRLDAMRVAAALGIQFLVADFEKEYKEEVVNYMVEAYQQGITPNPDVSCNRHIKFGAFASYVRNMGAQFIATGHYVQNVYSVESKKYELRMGEDKSKDQSYFLWQLQQEDLTRAMFPVGHLQKSEVRDIAKKFHLPTALKKDSQGLCFIGKVDLKDFLGHFLEKKEGKVLNKDGAHIGTHEGTQFYTIGQRHGYSVFTTTPNGPPQYIVAKDTAQNTITVSPKPFTGDFLKEKISISDENWISGNKPSEGEYLMRFRYRQQLEKCKLEYDTQGTTWILFAIPHADVTEGQSLVLYQGTTCLGGGIVK